MKGMLFFALSFCLISITQAQQKNMNKQNLQTATLAGGCFWCIEAAFSDLKGVEKVVSGYTGGTVKHPSYREVCTGTTGHAEAVQITFDPAVITFEELLEVFWTAHDPTTLNRQGADVGTQYRSAIFYHDKHQKEIAEHSIATVAAPLWEKEIVTEVVPFEVFYPAEDYHQDYFELNPNASYCRIVIAPKVQKVRKKFHDKLKK